MKKAFSIKKIISILSIGVCILFTIFLNAQTHVYSSFFVKQISLSARFNNSTSYGTAYGLKIGKITPSGDSISVDTLSPIAAGEIFSVNDSVSVGNKFFLQWKDQYYGTLYYLYEYDLNSNEIIRFDGLPQPYFKGAFLINGVYYYQAHYLYDTATSVIHTYKFDGTNQVEISGLPFGCDSITTSTTSNAINLSGLSNTNAIQVFNNAWSANVFTQTTNALTLNIPNLTGGQTYHVKIQQYDTKDGPWKFICERTIDVTVSVGNDLAVSISATPTTYKQFTNQNFKISVANSGNAAFTNVKIVLTVPDKLVGGATATTSAGTWNSYCAGGIKCNTWTIPNIAANTTATMEIGFFVNDATGPLSVSATLNASTPTDTNTANNTATVVLNPATNLQNQFENEALQSSTVFGIEKISPNPSDGEIEIKVVTARAEEVEFRFVNTLGNAVLSEKRNTEAGINNLYFDTSTFSSGIYFVVPQTKSGKIAPTKFVKL